MDISNNDAAFRSAASDFTFFIHQDDIESDFFTDIHIRLNETASLDCYSNEYEQIVSATSNRIEKEVKQQQEQARYEAVYKEAETEIDEAKAEMEAEFKKAERELLDAQKELAAGKRELAASEIQLTQKESELQRGKQELAAGETKLNQEEASAKQEIAKARQEMKAGRTKLLDGEKELKEEEKKYQDKKQEAQQEIADAYQALNEIEAAKWYIQDRNNLDSYAALKTDMASIESIGNAVPVIFLVVAVLISLTTMTRMVEEERGLLGVYKAMGFSDLAIYGKYVVYAALACFTGGMIGDLLGFIILPQFLLTILKSLYVLPDILLQFEPRYGIGGILLFLCGIVGAAVLACRNELRRMPAKLMRPKSPRNGSRVALERLTFIWKRLKFLDKVTVRNLFRYKKRMLMTIVGIVGCTALIVAGFAIKDTVMALMPKQYDNIYQYDFMAVVAPPDHAKFQKKLAADEAIQDYLNIYTANMKLLNEENKGENVQLFVIPDGHNLDSYIKTVDTVGKPQDITTDGIYVTRNAALLLDISIGDRAVLQDMELKQSEAKVSGILSNYLGNNVYMSQKLFVSLFGKYEPNGVLAHFREGYQKQSNYITELVNNEMILSTLSVAQQKTDFATNFTMLNSVVYVIIILAAGLAFVVLFTLSNTNISERSRELATTKVLGFYDREVHSYVNKETLILTGIGIVLGLIVGIFVSDLLTAALKMPAIYFETQIAPISFFYAAIISFSFALIVNLMTNRTLDQINMVEALKSVE
jgi:putative ABC transport system permease protein